MNPENPRSTYYSKASCERRQTEGFELGLSGAAITRPQAP